jgi:outer membrane protein insertion porin family
MPETKINIVSVEFQGENPLSDAQREQLFKHIQQQDLWTTPEEPDSSWVNQGLEPMRDALRERGYFKTNVEGTPYLVLAQANERRYVLSVSIESGPQYRLGKMRFASVSDKPLVFTDAILRQQINLQEGDLFDVTKTRQGLESISRLYGSKGYIDATPEPDTTIDEKSSRIDLLIKVDEQKPYRVAKIELLGLGKKVQNELSAPQQVGDFFNPALWHTFFKDNETRLPPDSSPNRNMPVSRDTANGTVDITLDFRPCPHT